MFRPSTESQGTATAKNVRCAFIWIVHFAFATILHAVLVRAVTSPLESNLFTQVPAEIQ